MIKLLVVTGGPTHRHKIELVPSGFYTLFEGYDDLEWDHATDHEAAFYKSRIDEYDVILLFNHENDLSEVGKQNLSEFVNANKGVVVFHSALGSYNDWDWWWKEVVGAKYQNQETEEFKKTEFHLNQQFKVTKSAEHPVTQGFDNFMLDDELYRGLNIRNDATILLDTDHELSDGPVAWVSPFEKSRVVAIQPGHANPIYKDMNFRRLVYQSIKWVASH